MQAKRVICIRQSLVDAMHFEREPAPPPKPPRQYVVPNEVVALMRGDRELRGMTIKVIALLRGFTVNQVTQVCEYRDRIHIDPR